MKKTLFLLCLSTFLFSTNLVARSPAVLPGVEIEPEQALQKNFKNAKGKSFSKFRPKKLTTTLQKPVQKKSDNSFLEGFTFFMTLLLPGLIASIIMTKAHTIPIQSKNIKEDEQEDEDNIDIPKAS